MASPVRCAHLGLASRAGLCRCRAAESVKGAARVQDSRLESQFCCERGDREDTPRNFLGCELLRCSPSSPPPPSRCSRPEVRRAPAAARLPEGRCAAALAIGASLMHLGRNEAPLVRHSAGLPCTACALGHTRGSSSAHSTSPLPCAARSPCSQIGSWTLAAHRTLHRVCGLPPRLLSLRSGGPTGAVGCSRAEIPRRVAVRRDRCAARRRLCATQGRGVPIAHRKRVRFPPAAHAAQSSRRPRSHPPAARDAAFDLRHHRRRHFRRRRRLRRPRRRHRRRRVCGRRL